MVLCKGVFNLFILLKLHNQQCKLTRIRQQRYHSNINSNFIISPYILNSRHLHQIKIKATRVLASKNN